MEPLTKSNPENSEIQNASSETMAGNLHHQIVLDSPLRQSLIPSVSEKAEFIIWADRELDEPQESRIITVRQMLSDLEVVPGEALDETTLPAQIDRLKSLLKENEIFIKTFTNIPDQQLYHFITEEFFNMEITGKKYLRPWRLIYEEFHPTDEYLIRKQTSDFLRSLFGYEVWKYAWKRWKRVLKNYKEIKSFVWQYEGFDDVEVLFDRIVIHENEATIYFHARFVAVHSDGVFITRYDGHGEGRLHRTPNGWCLIEILLPEKVCGK